MYLVTAKEAKKIEELAAQRVGGSTYHLMETIGTKIAGHIASEFKPAKNIVVICGGGNNGGDGLVVARELIARKYNVSIFSTIEPTKWSGDASKAYKSLSRHKPQVVSLSEIGSNLEFENSIRQADLVVDAIFGSGLSREVKGLEKYTIDCINSFARLVYSIDIPSGFHSDSGAMMGAGVKAGKTFAAGAVKRGLVQFPCAGYIGELEFADMGATAEDFEKHTSTRTIEDTAAAGWLPKRKADSHKKAVGRIGVIAGSTGMGGAAYLTAKACARAGAGIVYLFTPKSLASSLQSKVTETILVPLPESNMGAIPLSATNQINSYADSLDVLVIGPGLSRRDETVSFVRHIVSSLDIDIVLDADGINAVSQQAGVLKNRKAKTIITPHPGEFSKFFSVSTQEVQSNRVDYALRAARDCGSIVVLKGARTVVASPGGRAYICVRGNSGMASAGTGDVLSGIIGGLLGQKADPLHAAVLGVQLHATAGDFAADDLTEYSLIAEDLIDYLPVVFKYYTEIGV